MEYLSIWVKYGCHYEVLRIMNVSQFIENFQGCWKYGCCYTKTRRWLVNSPPPYFKDPQEAISPLSWCTREHWLLVIPCNNLPLSAIRVCIELMTSSSDTNCWKYGCHYTKTRRWLVNSPPPDFKDPREAISPLSRYTRERWLLAILCNKGMESRAYNSMNFLSRSSTIYESSNQHISPLYDIIHLQVEYGHHEQVIYEPRIGIDV
jgi:hypothetical protein